MNQENQGVSAKTKVKILVNLWPILVGLVGGIFSMMWSENKVKIELHKINTAYEQRMNDLERKKNVLDYKVGEYENRFNDFAHRLDLFDREIDRIENNQHMTRMKKPYDDN